jgi:hypothetical protein
VEGVASYIDDALLGGALTSLLILLGIAWLLFLQNWLWRAWLEKERGVQFREAAETLGLAIRRPGFGPRLRAASPRGEPALSLMLSGGWRGAVVVLRFRAGGRTVRHRASLDSLESLGEWAQAHLSEKQDE